MSRKSRYGRHLLTALMAVAFVVWGGPATSWAGQAGSRSAAPAALTERAASPPSPTSQAASVDESYASREAASKDLESFKGGDVVIIGSTGVIIILLVLLIILI